VGDDAGPAAEEQDRPAADKAEDVPAPETTPRSRVAAPTFVAPPPTGDDQELRLFDQT
jgi:hypothetical protein